MYYGQNEDKDDSLFANTTKNLGSFLPTAKEKINPMLIKVKTFFFNTLTLIRNDRMAACTTIICLTMLICTEITCSKLSAIYHAIPSSDSVSDYETHSALSKISSTLYSIDNHTSNIGS